MLVKDAAINAKTTNCSLNRDVSVVFILLLFSLLFSQNYVLLFRSVFLSLSILIIAKLFVIKTSELRL